MTFNFLIHFSSTFHYRVSAERPLGPNLCRLVKKKKCDSRSPILSRYDQVPFWIFSLKMCSSPISTNDICSLCEVVRALSALTRRISTIGFPAHFRHLFIQFHQFSIQCRPEKLTAVKSKVRFRQIVIHIRFLSIKYIKKKISIQIRQLSLKFISVAKRVTNARIKFVILSNKFQ